MPSHSTSLILFFVFLALIDFCSGKAKVYIANCRSGHGNNVHMSVFNGGDAMCTEDKSRKSIDYMETMPFSCLGNGQQRCKWGKSSHNCEWSVSDGDTVLVYRTDDGEAKDWTIASGKTNCCRNKKSDEECTAIW
eukprot:CAMPEP_0202703354 /NCGR_PEP_ID=MMETSP1385-20130828/16203_1 /ASSEMBLY_ACC=CAM_ASM_000861 /TAXON_ID=933848 /ORGANISM="Elphidium margaritaceum" /LENGTH=134 /DNA_ID=CAMNT_0049361189 /DNA_START=141 /DNA_END=542 /DNA_ORIENTATION=+